MKRILFAGLALFSICTASDQPNIVLILTDNHGAWTLGCYGNKDIRTPHLDQFASEGTLFSQAYAVNPVCSPTRASILTGLMPSQHGIATPTDGPFMMGPKAYNLLGEFTSLPEVLKANGYACGLSGKWHLGDNLHPQEGFDDLWVTMPIGSTSTFYGAEIIENGEVRTEPQYMTDLWTDRAVGFIEEQAKDDEKPFFLYLAYNGPYGLSRLLLEPIRNRHRDYYADHPLPSFPRVATRPWQFPNREYVNNLDAFRRYAAEVSGVDDGVGRVLQRIRDSGVEGDTIVVFTGDQGLGSGHNNLWGMGDHTRPLHLFDVTLRVPLIIRIPGAKVVGQQVDELVSQVDLFPTLLNLAGLKDEIPDENPLPGRDLSAVLRGEGSADPDRAVFGDYENTRSIRTKDWKLIERFDDNGKIDALNSHDELYHLKEDPGETENLYNELEAKAKREELNAQLDDFYETFSLPKHDMWNGGESQTHNIVMGDHAAERYKMLTEKRGYPFNPYDVDFVPPPMTIPDGLAVETAAAPPLVNHPVAGCLDDRGRLFLCENTGDNLKVDELEKRMQNKITVLTDTNRDGLFDQSETFADGFTFPQGVLWHDGALYVASPPSIWKLEDTDDDGKADKRTEIATGFGYNGNAASVHTPRVSPTGRLYWGHGRKQSTVKNIDGEVVHEGNTARIWTARPDGSDLRTFCGGGFANPVELDFWKTGEVIGNVNILLRNPNRSDCLVHWQHGGVYPRYGDGNMLEEFTQTGPLLREFVNFGHVAVSGLIRYRSGELSVSGEDWTDDFFMTLFNTQELVRLDIERDGSGFRSSTHPFLTIHDPDVHLVGVLEDADGSLLLIDTGGWFREGCPQSGFAKPDIAGAVYRIRKAGVYDRETDFRGEKIAWDSADPSYLCSLLSDSRFAVRRRAADELAARGEEGVDALSETLASHPDAETRIRAVFALGRSGVGRVNAILRNALRDREPEVRIAASQAIGEVGDKAAVNALLKNLHHASEALQRETAVALGRIGDPAAVPDLVSALSSDTLDRPREHALIRALFDIGDVKAINEAFGASLAYYEDRPDFLRRRLIVLNGLDPESLAAEDVITHLLAENEPLSKQAVELLLARPEWARKTQPELKEFLAEPDMKRSDIVQEILALAPKENADSVAAYLANSDSRIRDIALGALADARKIDAHSDWIEPLREMLKSADETVLAAAASFEPQPFSEEIRAIAEDESRSNLVRVQALGIVDGDRNTFSDEAFDLLESILIDPTKPSSERLRASRLLAGETRVQSKHRLRAAKLLAKAGPLEFPILFERIRPVRNDSEIGGAIVEAYLHAPGAHSVPPAERKRLLVAMYEPDFWKEPAAELEKQIAAERNVTRRIERLESLVVSGRGDVSRGETIAMAEKTACVVCHRIGEKGNHLGPDLSHIGRIRKPADLLESILLPSASLAQDYEAYAVKLNDGKNLMGVLKNEFSESVELGLVTGETQTISRDKIDSLDPVPVSLMPPGLDQTLSEQELVDLVTYLTGLE